MVRRLASNTLTAWQADGKISSTDGERCFIGMCWGDPSSSNVVRVGASQ